MSGGRPLPDPSIGTLVFRPRRRRKATPQPGVAPPAAPASPAAPAAQEAPGPAELAASQMVLMARIDRLRGQLTNVVAELRALEKRTRRGGVTADEAAEEARLRSQETRLHREIAGLREELARLRGGGRAPR